MIEQLLQFLIRVIDTQLLKRIHLKRHNLPLNSSTHRPYLEDLEARYIQNTKETRSLPCALVEGPIYSYHQPFEHPLIHGFTDCFDGKFRLFFGLSSRYHFSADLYSWFQKGLRHIGHREAE